MYYILVYQDRQGTKPPVIRETKEEIYDWIDNLPTIRSYEIFKGDRIDAKTFTWIDK